MMRSAIRSPTGAAVRPLGRRGGSSAPIWTPAENFKLGTEPGLWYNPTFANLYQDSAGSSPATAAGQPAGLMLDQRLVPVALPTTGWVVTSGDGVLSVNGNTVTITGATTTTRIDLLPSGWDIGNVVTMDISTTIISASGVLVWLGGTPTATSAGRKTYANTVSGGNICRLQITSGTASFEILDRKKYLGYHISRITVSERPLTALLSGVQCITTDGLDDAMSATVTLGASMDLFIAVRRTSTTGILAYTTPGSGVYLGALDGTAGAASAGAGTPTYAVNGVDVAGGTATTRAQLAAAIPIGAWSIVEIRNANLSAWAAFAFGGYTGFAMGAGWAQIIACAAGDAATRTKNRQYCAAKAGITL